MGRGASACVIAAAGVASGVGDGARAVAVGLTVAGAGVGATEGTAGGWDAVVLAGTVSTAQPMAKQQIPKRATAMTIALRSILSP